MLFMRLDKLLERVEIIKTNCSPDMDITDIAFDSRRAGPGVAYVAARRIGANGHDYLASAIENGASVVVAEREMAGAPCVVVPDGNRAMAVMSANLYGNPANRLKIVGITGTKGKSTTAFMIKTILERVYACKVGLIGTLGVFAGDEMLEPAHNTTPEAPELHRLFAQFVSLGCTYAVMEVSSHSLAIDRVWGIPFAASVFTNLSQDHLDYHVTMENYLRAKAKLFDMAPIAAVNGDDSACAYLMEHTSSKKLRFSAKTAEADLWAERIDHHSSSGVAFDAVTASACRRVHLSSPGGFMVYNALAAIGCAMVLGISMQDAADAVSHTRPVPGRVQTVEAEQGFRVIVDYAHTPESVRQMSETAREFTKGRLISVFGCGGNRDRTKRPRMGEAAAAYADLLVVTTDNPRFEEPEGIIADILPGIDREKCPTEVIPDRRAAIRRAIDLAAPGDTVLIMGKGHETYQEVRGVRSHFDDREEVESYLKRGDVHD